MSEPSDVRCCCFVRIKRWSGRFSWELWDLGIEQPIPKLLADGLTDSVDALVADARRALALVPSDALVGRSLDAAVASLERALRV